MFVDVALYGSALGAGSIIAQMRERAGEAKGASVRPLSASRALVPAGLGALYGGLACVLTDTWAREVAPNLSDSATPTATDLVAPRAAAGLTIAQVALVGQLLVARAVSPSASFTLPRATRVQVLLGGLIVGAVDGAVRHAGRSLTASSGPSATNDDGTPASSPSFLDSLPPWVPIKRTETGVSLRQKRREWLEREGVVVAGEEEEEGKNR